MERNAMYIALILSPDKDNVTGYGSFDHHEDAEDFAIRESASANNEHEDIKGWSWLVLWLNPTEHPNPNTMLTEANNNAEILN